MEILGQFSAEIDSSVFSIGSSRAPRGRVDRNVLVEGIEFDLEVAPLAGAWIETPAKGG